MPVALPPRGGIGAAAPVVRFARLIDRRGKADSIRPHQTPFRTALYGSRLTGAIESIRFFRWRTDEPAQAALSMGTERRWIPQWSGLRVRGRS
jgi:hypothetical protein